MPGAGFAPTKHNEKRIKKSDLTKPFSVSQQGAPPRTLAPQRDTLLLVRLADAVVAVAIDVVAGVAIVQVDVGGAVWAGAGAELGEIAGVTGLTARSSCRLQLRRKIKEARPTAKLKALN